MGTYFAASRVASARDPKCLSCSLASARCCRCRYCWPLRRGPAGEAPRRGDGRGLRETIIGANVILKGTTTGAVTDIDGRFELLLTSCRRTPTESPSSATNPARWWWRAG